MKIAVVHFQPVEKYPPVMNLIKFWSDNDFKLEFSVLSSKEDKISTNLDQGRVKRLISLDLSSRRIHRLYKYLLFHVKSLFFLIKYRPDAILYFETLSAAAVWWYKNLINNKVRVFIHYHEYTSLDELKKGMAFNRWLHSIERKNYQKAEQISHTNLDRINLFKEDEQLNDFTNFIVVPNYPPLNWLANKKLHFEKKAERFVYVGAVSEKTMFLPEVLSFFSKHKNLSLDIYSSNITSESKRLIDGISTRNIELKGSVDYFDLPQVLKNYDVGLIIYRGTTENYTYNAPNKLFEYLACGLNVWVSKEMKGVIPYYRTTTRPYVTPVDFADIESLEAALNLDTQKMTDSQVTYYCEQIFEPLTNNLINGHFKYFKSSSQFQGEATIIKNDA